MPGMQFQYDEDGGKFYYFLLSFLAFILFPCTYYFWPRKDTKDDHIDKHECQCIPCINKNELLKSKRPWKAARRFFLYTVLILGWILFFYVAYKASQVELDFTEFDPYHELEIDRGATDKEIKKAYRSLSLIHHPDKETGDEKKFMRIAKAYQALTDEEARKNWEEHGNPDGPGAMHFGIALPKWIVEKQNSVWVLAVYGLVFMVILPVAVGSWWYKSIKFSSEHILMDTEKVFQHFIMKTPNMTLHRVLMILAASLEFNKKCNNEVQERPSDNIEVPEVMKRQSNLGEKNKEMPLCYGYSMKARILIHAHLNRTPLPSNSLEIDKNYILKKCPFLINEMIKIAQVFCVYGMMGRVPPNRVPKLETIENMMRLSQMLVQGCWDKNSFLQLPHLSEEFTRYFNSKKRHVRNIRDLVKMHDADRRMLLRGLTDLQYKDIINVCSTLPLIDMTHEVKVVDDEDTHTITAGSLVTVEVHLKRKDMSCLFTDQQNLPNGLNTIEPEYSPAGGGGGEGDSEEEAVVETEEGDKKDVASTNSKVNKSKVWEKNKKKKGGSKKSNKANKKGKAANKNPANQVKDTAPEKKSVAEKSKKPEPAEGENSEGESTDDESEGAEEEANAGEEEEVDWDELQKDIKKETILENQSSETHMVHCPFFPGIKYEWWWLYIAETEKKHGRRLRLVAGPNQVCSLRDFTTVELKFEAPSKKGHYFYNIVLRSDSLINDFDQIIKFDINVSEAKQIESHPQWDFSDEEEDEKDNAGSDSDDEDDSDSDSDE